MSPCNHDHATVAGPDKRLLHPICWNQQDKHIQWSNCRYFCQLHVSDCLSVCLYVVCKQWPSYCIDRTPLGVLPCGLTLSVCGLAQHADKLATLERREADLKAQHNALANDAQEFKDKEGKSFSFVCFWVVCAATLVLPSQREKEQLGSNASYMHRHGIYQQAFISAGPV